MSLLLPLKKPDLVLLSAGLFIMDYMFHEEASVIFTKAETQKEFEELMAMYKPEPNQSVCAPIHDLMERLAISLAVSNIQNVNPIKPS